MTHLLSMGYAAYVWPSFAASLLGIGGIAIFTLRDYARAKRRLSELENDDRS